MPPSFTARSAVGIALGLIAVAAVATAPVAATPVPDGEIHPSLVVSLEPNGSATVTVQYTYDLETDAEQEAFRSLETDKEAKRRAIDRFTSGMAGVAADASNATGRTMRVRDTTIDLRRAEDNRTGVVTFTFDWIGLARVDGDRLVLTEPFASGYHAGLPVTVQAPDEYQMTTFTPDPSSSRPGQATWDPGTDLTGFELVAERTGNGGPKADTDTTASAPGFGVLMGMLGVLGALLLARRQQP